MLFLFSIPVLIEHDLVPGFQMHFHRAHLLGDILAGSLYQPLAQVGSELRPCVGGDIDAAAQRAAHVGGNLPDDVIYLSAITLFSASYGIILTIWEKRK